MSQEIGALPWRIDSFGLALCHRPRLYWISWELVEGPGVSLQPPEDTSWYGFGSVKLTAEIEQSHFLLAGCTLSSEEGLPTFTTSRPRSSPGNRPAGLWQCQDHELSRWREDDYRYPPYQYRDKYLISGLQGLRMPTISEKEVIMGFPVGYTVPCMPKSKQSGRAYSDCRHSLIGNSWCVQVVTWLLSNLFHPLGQTTFHSVSQIVQQTSPGRSDGLRAFLVRPPLNSLRGPDNLELEVNLARKLSSFVSIKGEDILLQSPSENIVKFQRLRASVPARLWRWRVVAGWRWKFSNAHINELELRAALTTLVWRLERKRHHGCRFIHLVDSLVVLHCLSRGRSSSRKLRRPLSQVNSLLLASDSHAVWAYVSTKQNPADRPSRLKIRRNGTKKKKA